MHNFGKLLRAFRNKCNDPNASTGKLSQEQFGALIGEEMGVGYSGAAVSDWERSVSKIHADNRIVLVSLVKVLHQYGGLESLTEANALLEAGNYRALDARERGQVFPDEPLIALTTVEIHPTESLLLWAGLLSISAEKLRTIMDKAKDGPPPAWPRVMIAVLRCGMDRLNAVSILSFIVWIWIWLLAWVLIVPSWHWPFASREAALLALVLYSTGTIIIPALIATRTNTKDNPFWLEYGISNTWITRLYTHQGASVGFHLGYFVVFIIDLFRYNLGIPPITWIKLLALSIPIMLSYASARLVPYNLLLAYKRLKLSDGAIFFVFVLVGPAWGFFFLEFYSTLLQQALGLTLFLIAVTILAAHSVIQNFHKNKEGDSQALP